MTKPKNIEKITAVDTILYLGRAVAERGQNYVDPNSINAASAGGCIYFDIVDWETAVYSLDETELLDYGYLDDTTKAPACCIVGHVFDYKYREDRPDVISWIADCHNTEGVVVSANISGFDQDIMTEDARFVAAAAQSVQDRGGSWGDAYREAVHTFISLYTND